MKFWGERIIGFLMICLLVSLVVSFPFLVTERQRQNQAVVDAGYEAAQLDLPVEACPYAHTWHQEEDRQRWLIGWAAGRRAKKGGAP